VLAVNGERNMEMANGTVIVVGHTGCGGAIASYAQPKPSASAESAKPDTHLMQFLDPLIRFRHTLPEGSDVNDLIRENIKDGVGNLVVSPVCLFLYFESSSKSMMG
jgi:carbonic anhydrase